MSEKTHFSRKEFLQPSELKGIFVPTVTPFKMINGLIKVDVISQTRQIQRLIVNQKVDGIFLASNAGSGRQMDMDNLKTSIIEGIKAARSTKKNTPVVVGALRKNINEIIEVAKFAESNGADAIVLAPAYMEGDIDINFSTAHDKLNLPIILYNNPQFQEGKNLPFEFVDKAKIYDRVIGIKDTSGDPDYFNYLLKNFRSEVRRVMQGDTKAGLNPDILKADGMVPVEANFNSEVLMRLVNRNTIFDPSELKSLLDSIKANREKFGGSVEQTRKVLFDADVFSTELAYTSK